MITNYRQIWSSNTTGYSTTTGQILEQIKGAAYHEIGEIKSVTIPQDTPHRVIITAYDSGSFTLESNTLQGNEILNTTVLEAIPTATSTVATLVNTGTQIGTSTPLTLDFDGNGITDTQVIPTTGMSTVYDTTPPELKLTFSTSTKDVILSGIDDNSTTVSYATTSINIVDTQGNLTKISYSKLKDQSTKLKLVFNQITRNGTVTTTPNTHILYDWKLDNQGNLKDLDTKVIIKGVEKYIFNYKKSSNTTTIKTKNVQTGQVTTTTRTGFVPVTVQTDMQNLLNVTY